MKVSLGGAVSVTATERWLSEIRAGNAFAGGEEIGPVAGQFSEVQLFNPAASGVTVLVFAAAVRVGTTGVVALRHHTAGLASDAVTEANLLLGQAAPVAQVKVATNVAQTGSLISVYGVLASENFVMPVGWVAELPAGRGIHFTWQVANIALRANFWWVEI